MLRAVKLVAVGDAAVGKTCLVTAYARKQFPFDDIPTPVNSDIKEVTVNGASVSVTLWDVADGEETREQLRRLSNPQIDIVLILFAINSRYSFKSVQTKWVHEIRHICPNTPFMLVGTKLDLRDTPSVSIGGKTWVLGPDPVTTEQGHTMAKHIGAIGYVECSARTLDRMEHVFNTAITAAIDPNTIRNPPPPMPAMPEPPLVSPLELNDTRFSAFINDSQYSDVTFKFNDRELHAHKVLLSVSCPIFQKMFVHHMEPPSQFIVSKTNAPDHTTIEVREISFESFILVLRSCYTASPPSSDAATSKAMEEAVTFFQRYPRFTAHERNTNLLELARNPTAPFTDICVELPSKKQNFCHKILLAAGSSHFSALLAESQSNNTAIKIDLPDDLFEDVKQFLYTTTEGMNFKTKPYSYSFEALPKLVKIKLDEYASHCICHLRDLVHDEDVGGTHGHVVDVLNLAEELDLKQLRAYCVWWLQINFDSVHKRPWFKNALSAKNQEEIANNRWPGLEYQQQYRDWEKSFKQKGQKKDKNCIVQ